jgi:hypothetical protein
VKCEDRQMKNTNRWVVDREYSIIGKFPHWQGKILRDENEKELEKTTKKIYALAYEEKLYRVIKKGKNGDDPEVLHGVTGFDFHAVKRTDGSYDSVDKNGLSWFYDCEQQCEISYYNLDGQITTEWVGNFFGFHVNLRPEKYIELDRGNPSRMCPDSLPIKIEQSYDNGYELYRIHLCSDIWFPKVVGWLDSEEQFYDNSELAALNSPRLNRFLQITKELILSLGGEWELVGTKPVSIDEYDENDVYEGYYPYGGNPRMIIPTKTVCIDGVQKEVYPPLSKYIGIENISPECQLSENGISLEIKVKPRNHWCMLAEKHGEDDIPMWVASFPAGRFETRQDIWPFIKTILEVGQQEEIFQIFEQETEFRKFIHDIDIGTLHVPNLESFCHGALESFYYYESYYHYGVIPDIAEELAIVDKLPEYTRNIQSMTTKISYYEKDGRLMDTYVKERDLGKFLYNYHLGTLGDYQSDYRQRFLSPYCGGLDFYEYLGPELSSGRCYLNIELKSDIWFPVVKGSLEKKVGIWHVFGSDESAYYEGGFDNRELANRHTPRLNRFLSAIAAKFTEMGGEWSIGEHVDPKYREQMTLTGIKLDV